MSLLLLDRGIHVLLSLNAAVGRSLDSWIHSNALISSPSIPRDGFYQLFSWFFGLQLADDWTFSFHNSASQFPWCPSTYTLLYSLLIWTLQDPEQYGHGEKNRCAWKSSMGFARLPGCSVGSLAFGWHTQNIIMKKWKSSSSLYPSKFFPVCSPSVFYKL